MLRRTKVERVEDIKLPPLIIKIDKRKLSAPEMDFYTAIYAKTQVEFNCFVEKGTVLHNFAHIFDLLSRLRQSVNHPYLIIHSDLNQRQLPSKSVNLKELNCSFCFEAIDAEASVMAKCKHYFHKLCIDEYIESIDIEAEIKCPTCMDKLTIVQDDLDIQTIKPKRKPNSIIHKINTENFETSTKIKTLIEYIKKSTEKSIVFSQYTKFLELIEFAFKREGIQCVTYTGSLTVDARRSMINEFILNKNINVICISLKAGGEGLNLQVASQIFIMDPWWNPASELQAIQRAHRIGQTRPVHAYRIIAEDTIEERILQLQEKKQLAFDGTIGNNNNSFQKLNADDIRFLFQ